MSQSRRLSQLVVLLRLEVVLLHQVIIHCLLLECKRLLIYSDVFLYDLLSHGPHYKVPTKVHRMHRYADLEDRLELLELKALLKDASTVHDKETKRYQSATQPENEPLYVE